MPLEPGTKLGPYEILSSLGAGDTGDVYKASDTQSNRTVALRVVPPWTAEQDMRERLERDRLSLAALKHPNICVIEDVGHEEETTFLVTEYLEGETLAKRLERGPLKARDASSLALAIADALDKAHRAGVTHRCLKPSNVMLTKAGPKLLDFGLAAPGAAELPAAAVTAPAKIPRTLQYCAPEQFDGTPSDARTDIFALGAILYEALTGKKAFDGPTRAVLIAMIATAHPEPLSKVQPAAGLGLEHIVDRCLAKNPDDRWQTVHDLLTQLRWITEGGAGAASLLAEHKQRHITLLRVITAAVILLAAALAVPAARYFRTPGDTGEFQFRVPVRGLSAADTAISPDGQTLALVARPNQGDAAALYVRRTAGLAFQRLNGTDNATQPFFSPDSRFIAFIAGGRLKRVSVSGGAPKDLSEAQGFTGGSWSSQGTIVFGSAKGVSRVSAEGGKVSAITTLDPQETGHFWPYFLPDAQHFLYLAWSAQVANRAVFIGKLDSKDKTRLMAADSNAAYAAPGYVMFHRGASLFAQAFDAAKLTLAGEPVHVADDVADNPANGRGNFDVSQNGALLYFQGAAVSVGRGQTANIVRFGWLDRTGRQVEVAGEAGPYGDMDLSPDGKLIAVTKQEAGSSADIWIVDWQRAGVSSRLTLDPADDINPVWSSDGTRVAFTSYRKGNADILVKNANGVGPETPMLESSSDEIVEDWSKDGRYIAYLFGQENYKDIYALPLSGDKKPLAVVQGKYQKDEPQFSYDGKWLAYTSDESGMFQVYVVSFPEADQKLQVSMAGGGQPRWKRDGNELYFRAPDNRIMAVDIRTGARLEALAPRLLLTPTVTNNMTRDPARHQLAVTPDGTRFLLRVPPGAPGTAGGASGVPQATIQAVQTGQPGAAGVAAAPANIINGLTVVRGWTAMMGKAAP